MRCLACDAELPAGAKFCNGCGAAQALPCPACAHGNPPGSRFCLECGGSLGGAFEPAGERASATPSPRSYTPPHLAERILASAGALEGERKQVTVLFADLKGSTELIQGLDPEDAQQ